MGRIRDPVHGHYNRVAGSNSSKCNHCKKTVKWSNLKQAWGHFSGNKIGTAWQDGCPDASEELREEARRRVDGYKESTAKRSSKTPQKELNNPVDCVSPQSLNQKDKLGQHNMGSGDESEMLDTPKTTPSRLQKAITLLQDANNSAESPALNKKQAQESTKKKLEPKSTEAVPSRPSISKEAPAICDLMEDSDSSTTEPPTPPKNPPKKKTSRNNTANSSREKKPATPLSKLSKRKTSRPDSANASVQGVSSSVEPLKSPRSKRKQPQSGSAKTSTNGSTELADKPSQLRSKKNKLLDGDPTSGTATLTPSKRKQPKTEIVSGSKTTSKKAKRSLPSSSDWKGRLCSTGLVEGQRVLLNGVASVNHTPVKDDFDKRVTHMITNARGPEDKPTRTMKLCKAIAAGIDLVCFNWIEDSGSSGSWKNVKDYIHPWTKKGRDPLFLNTHFYFGNLGDKAEDKDEYVSIVKLGGGEVLTMKPNSKISSNPPKLIFVEAGSKKGPSRSGRRVSLSNLAEAIPGAEVVEPVWILDQCHLVVL